ncbi:hypothetical protein Fcan01_27143 [Folsomia candida]|uniref:Tumor protein p53-inducible protein 11 n=1 Tax=Folsomia candida TaxID=158441 RepID=A0A226CYR6_FOLCA|nr:hypothetical protein Fcan01_27143 [Folsomia candida]
MPPSKTRRRRCATTIRASTKGCREGGGGRKPATKIKPRIQHGQHRVVSSSSLTFFLRGGSEWMDVQVLGVNREAEEKAGRQQQARRGDKMKHSSGDLHSRLKTRKMLGVGETDNGDIHRSKISQVLGHNEHLYLKLPKGYWNWQGFLASLLAFQAGFIILLPESSAQLGLIGVQTPTHYVPSQYYAVTMLALSYLIWKFLNIKDKMVTRATLVAILLHFSSLCAVDLLHAIRSGQWSTLVDVKGLTMMGLRGLTLIVSFTYLYRMGTATSGLRKSPSYKDVSSDHNNTANQNRRE